MMRLQLASATLHDHSHYANTFAEYLEDNGDQATADAVRNKKPIIETDLDGIRDSCDWAQVFADENAGNVSKTIEPCPEGADVSLAPFVRDDIEMVLASSEGENDGLDWIGVFKLKDGRFLLAYGGCDYTGWD